MPEYKLPDVGEGLTEAEIVSWKVKVGDTIEINDVVVEIETAKSLVELPSPYAGEISALLVEEGQMVPVGTPIISIGAEAAGTPAPGEPAPEGASKPPFLGEPGSEGADAAPQPPDLSSMDLSNPAASGGGEGESLVGRNKADRGPQRRARKAAAPVTEAGAATQLQVQGAFTPGGVDEIQEGVDLDEAASTDGPPVPATPAEPAPAADVRVLAKPPVRKLAKDLGVDLATLVASGPHGSITRDDVQSAATSSEAVAPATTTYDVPATGERERREPVKGVRKMMSQAMVDSAFSAPHVTEWVTIDVTPTMELVARLKTRRELRDLRITPLLVLARAVCLAVRRTPEINSTWDEAAQEVVYKRYVNLGIAAATPRGLVVPNVKDADSLSLSDLAEALGELTATARAGKTQPADMAGGTLTITNVGPFGVDGGTPIINPGESAILCFGATKRQPWVVSDGAGAESLEIRDVCTLSLSFDHRHIDGELGSRFLSDVAGIMADPGTALLY